MKRVLFIETDLRNEKLGIMYLSAALKKRGHETLLCRYEKEDFDMLIQSFSPDLVAFSLITGAHKRSLEIARDIRKNYGIPTVAGGPHATFFSQDIPEDAVDFVVVGQGEKAIVDVVEGRARGRFLCYDFTDLNEIPFPDRSLFYRYEEFRDNPMKNVISMRDCPYSCSYCYNHSWKKMFRGQNHFMQRRSVDGVIGEIKEMRDHYMLEKVLFIDDNFLINDMWIGEFAIKYGREIGLPFLCSFRVNLLDEEKLKMLRDAGLFMVNFALESADPYVQSEILHRDNIKNEHIIRAIELFRNYDIKCRMQNMIGLPVEDSLQDALGTLEFNKTYRVDDSWVSIFQPYPNTELAEYCFKNGFLEASMKDSIAESFFDESRLKIDNKNKIKKLQKWWFFIVHYNLSDRLIDVILNIDINNAVSQSLLDLRYKFSKKYLYEIENENGSMLLYDWDDICNRFKSAPNFKLWKHIIKKYELCGALSEILLDIDISDEIAKELANVQPIKEACLIDIS